MHPSVEAPRLLCATIVAASLFVLPSMARASERTDVMTAVHKWADDYNKGDSKAVTTVCSAQAVIVDDFAPHIWQGANACSDWLAADAANNRLIGSRNGTIAMGTPWHVMVHGDRAYVVAPVKYFDVENGKKNVQSAVWTVILQKSGSAWNIAGSAWADH